MPRRHPHPTSARVLVAAVVLVAACGSGAGDVVPDPAREPASATPTGDLDGEVLVSAAASLTDAFATIERAFEDDHPGVDVVLNLGGSSSLREQVLEGAPVDVFASANRANMDRVVAAGAATRATPFATNRLQVAVPPGNPADVTGLEQFGDEDLFLGLCAEQVPCGTFARRALDAAGVTPRVDTAEPDVRALLTKVEAGELDAAITYVTDVASTDGAVSGIDVPEGSNVVAEYPIAVLADAPNATAAEAFVAFVLGERGRELLTAAGFGAP